MHDLNVLLLNWNPLWVLQVMGKEVISNQVAKGCILLNYIERKVETVQSSPLFWSVEAQELYINEATPSPEIDTESPVIASLQIVFQISGVVEVGQFCSNRSILTTLTKKPPLDMSKSMFVVQWECCGVFARRGKGGGDCGSNMTPRQRGPL